MRRADGIFHGGLVVGWMVILLFCNVLSTESTATFRYHRVSASVGYIYVDICKTPLAWISASECSQNQTGSIQKCLTIKVRVNLISNAQTCGVTKNKNVYTVRVRSHAHDIIVSNADTTYVAVCDFGSRPSQSLSASINVNSRTRRPIDPADPGVTGPPTGSCIHLPNIAMVLLLAVALLLHRLF